MQRPNIDNERKFDWGRTSSDYAKFRPGYPESFYDTLQVLGIGKEGQNILDLGTGTGVLARAFAKRGANVAGIDIAENQVEEAKVLAELDGIKATFEICRAEDMEVPNGIYDVNHCHLHENLGVVESELHGVSVPV